MLKLKKNLKPRFEQLISKLMNEQAGPGIFRKRTWKEAACLICKKHPDVYEKYLKQLTEIAKTEKMNMAR
jgi:hypothetical protein